MTSSIASAAASAGVIAASGLYTAYRERVRAMESKRLDRFSGTRA